MLRQIEPEGGRLGEGTQTRHVPPTVSAAHQCPLIVDSDSLPREDLAQEAPCGVELEPVEVVLAHLEVAGWYRADPAHVLGENVLHLLRKADGLHRLVQLDGVGGGVVVGLVDAQVLDERYFVQFGHDLVGPLQKRGRS